MTTENKFTEEERKQLLIDSVYSKAKKDMKNNIEIFFNKNKIKIDSIIRKRIASEFKKFKDGDIDWKLTSAIKIRKNFEDLIKSIGDGE